jgi:hypothetical protein
MQTGSNAPDKTGGNVQIFSNASVPDLAGATEVFKCVTRLKHRAGFA